MIELREPRPSSQSRGVRLRTTAAVPAPLRASMADVEQGNLAGCPVVATLAALARTRPARIGRMLGAAVNDRVRSTAPDGSKIDSGHYYDVDFPGNADPVRISGLIYHRRNDVEYAHTSAGAGWPSLLEKAYAVWRGRNSYDRLDLRSTQQAPDGGRVICDLVGSHDMAHIVGRRFYAGVSCANRTATSDRALAAVADVTAMARRSVRRPTIAASRSANTGHGIVASHAYAVVGYRNQRILLRNPHGGAGADVRISPADFVAEFQAVWQAA